MTRNLSLLLAALLVLSLGTGVQAGARCTKATLEGRYGVIQNGTFFGRGLFGGVGVMTFDGKGNRDFVATQVFEDTGVRYVTSSPGTYTVNEDCTGSSETIDGGATQDFVIVDGGRELRVIGTMDDRVITWIVKKQGLEACTNATIEGRYGITLNGKIRDRGLAGAVGFLTFDGEGSASYAATAVYEDTGLDHVTLEGTYTVNPSCKGSLLLGANAIFDFVIVGDGEEILQVATRSDRVVTWTMNKQQKRRR
jgi:hypothetical protein